MVNVKVLSLRQPWADLCVIPGAKSNETRNWITKYRGELFIHASKMFHFSDLELCRQDRFFKLFIPDPTILVTGAIIGKVTLVDCVPTESLDGKISKQERAFGDYSPGRFAWILENPIRLKQPIPTAESLSIWNYTLTEEQREVHHV